MPDFCGICGNEQLRNGVECDRCGATYEDGGWGYDPEAVQDNISDYDESMRRRGYEWDDYDRDYRRR